MRARIKLWYPKLWSLEMVKNAVEKGVITVKEYKEITGKEYE